MDDMVALLENYLPVLLALLAIFFMVAVLGYKKYIAPYMVFRTTWVHFKFLLDYITFKVPKNTSASVYMIKLFLEELKNDSDGFCVVWKPQPYLGIYNQEAMKILCTHQAAIKKAELYHILEDLMGPGLLPNRNIELWRKRRKMLQPAFSASVIKNYTTVFNEGAAALVEQLRMEANDPIEIIGLLKKCSSGNLMATVFGISLDDPELKANHQYGVHLFDQLGALVKHRTQNPLLHWKLTLPFFSTGRKFVKYAKEARINMEKILEKIEQEHALHSHAKEDEGCYGATLRRSFVDILLQNHLQDPSFTREDIIDECSSFIAGGYDTVAYGMMWCLFLLGNHQDVQDKAFNEVENLSGDHDISWEDVQNLTYIERVLKETLRMYPSVPAYGRFLEDDVKCGKYNIPKGTNIVIFLYQLHRDPAVFPNPEKFDPERFSNNADRKPGICMTFAEGLRNCPGKNYAMTQMKITLAYILRNFKVTSLQREEDINLDWEVILTSSPPIPFRLTPRCHD